LGFFLVDGCHGGDGRHHDNGMVGLDEVVFHPLPETKEVLPVRVYVSGIVLVVSPGKYPHHADNEYEGAGGEYLVKLVQ
jgi:hypothetical protein